MLRLVFLGCVVLGMVTTGMGAILGSTVSHHDDEFRCIAGDGIISVRWRCDGDNDCPDGSDEINCNNIPIVTTTPTEDVRQNELTGSTVSYHDDQFRCIAGDGIISVRWRCDGENDCPDGSDEINCDRSTVSYHDNQFHCITGDGIISVMWRCDGKNDCPDGSDEINCNNIPIVSTSPTEDVGQNDLTDMPIETTTPTEDVSQNELTDTTIATDLTQVDPKDITTNILCIKSVPEESHITDLLLSANRSSDGANYDNALTDGRYYLFHVELNWFQAVELCHQLGLHSATFNSEVDYNQLSALITQKNGYDQEASYWTAGSDLGKRGKWVWHPLGRPLMYTRWAGDEPSDLKSDNPVERCIELKGSKGYMMNDCHCDVKNYVICEINK